MFTLVAALFLAAQSSRQEDAGRFNLLMEQARAARHEARYAEAERLCREAEPVARRLLPSVDALLLVRNELGLVLTWLGRHDEAIELMEEALPAAMKHSTQVYLATAVNLGTGYRGVGRLPEAESVLRRALRAPGAGEFTEALSARSQLAGIEGAFGRRKAAETLYREVLAEQTRRLGPLHRETLATLAGLIERLIAWKRLAQAEPLALRLVADNAKAQLAVHPAQATGLYYLGLVYAQRKQYTDAAEQLVRAREILEASVGKRSSKVVTVLNVLASVEAGRGNLGAALDLSREAVSICEETLGPRHPAMGLALSAHADILHRLKRHDLARQARVRALAIARESSAGAATAGQRIDWETLRRENGH